MVNINTDLLEIISNYLNYDETFTINLLSGEIHNIFKYCTFANRTINVKNSKNIFFPKYYYSK